MLLDLDDSETWVDDFYSLLKDNEQRMRDVWNACRVSPFECQLDLASNEFMEKLRADSLKIFDKNYSEVTGYHGCCVTADSTYQKEGILQSSTESARRSALEIFKGISGVKEVVESELLEKSKQNDTDLQSWGTVGLQFSGKVDEDGPSDYLGGSEFLRGVAEQLRSDEAMSRLMNLGTPSFIKCGIPVEWLNHCPRGFCRQEYPEHVLRRIVYRSFVGEEPGVIGGGFMVKHHVLPSQMFDIVDMSEYFEKWI